MMMVVMPAFTKRQQRQPKIIPAVVFGGVSPLAPTVSQ
jgi:hypothetical protein